MEQRDPFALISRPGIGKLRAAMAAGEPVKLSGATLTAVTDVLEAAIIVTGTEIPTHLSLRRLVDAVGRASAVRDDAS